MALSFATLACWSAAVVIASFGIYHSGSDLSRRNLTWKSTFIEEETRIEGVSLADIQAFHNYNHVEHLRILTMGASRTFGATLHDRFGSAYPYLLSPNATNLAIRATGPDYPALCTYSMIGEHDQFDAIILEFYVDADEYLIILARRLRRRFPQAAIIVLRLWGPLQYIHLPTDRPQGLRDFLDQHSLGIHDPNFLDVLRTTTNPDDWYFEPYSQKLDVQQRVIEETGAILFELPRPENPFDAFEQYRHFFASDLVHISETGHEMIADYLRGVLAQVQRSDVKGEWAHDYCQSWFESGKDVLRSHPNVVMTEFDSNSHKWALEIRSSPAWITAKNPLDRTAQIFVRYMMTTPPPGLYPTTMVSIEGGGMSDKVIVNPTGENKFSRTHVNRVAKVGSIQPGEQNVVFTSLEDGKQFPFRVTGIVITPFDEELLL